MLITVSNKLPDMPWNRVCWHETVIQPNRFIHMLKSYPTWTFYQSTYQRLKENTQCTNVVIEPFIRFYITVHLKWNKPKAPKGLEYCWNEHKPTLFYHLCVMESPVELFLRLVLLLRVWNKNVGIISSQFYLPRSFCFLLTSNCDPTEKVLWLTAQNGLFWPEGCLDTCILFSKLVIFTHCLRQY